MAWTRCQLPDVHHSKVRPAVDDYNGRRKEFIYGDSIRYRGNSGAGGSSDEERLCSHPAGEETVRSTLKSFLLFSFPHCREQMPPRGRIADQWQEKPSLRLPEGSIWARTVIWVTGIGGNVGERCRAATFPVYRNCDR